MISMKKAGDDPDTRSGRVQRAMIVDDHELYRLGLRNFLNAIEGFEVVVEASTCQEALAHIETRPVDLVFLNLALPDGDALHFIRTMKRHISSPDVIVLSTTLTDSTLFHAFISGASGYITKNIPVADLTRILQLLQFGHSNKEIATRLAISHFTVGKHVQNILRKLGVMNRTQAVSYTLFEGGTQKGR